MSNKATYINVTHFVLNVHLILHVYGATQISHVFPYELQLLPKTTKY